MAEKNAFISFPPGYLGPDPAKLDLLVNTDTCFAIGKPGGMAVSADAWSAGLPNFSAALRRQVGEGKPQLKRLGIGAFFPVYALDPEISGVCLFAKTADSDSALRNDLGSRLMTFRYELLLEPDIGDKQVTCELPLARHQSEAKMIVSHRFGKRTQTTFAHERSFGRYHLWTATSTDLRAHQIRVHAAESGLRIVGESLYALSRPVMLSAIKRGYRSGEKEETPLYEGLCLHLREVSFGVASGGSVVIKAPRPRKFEVLLKKLAEFGG